MWRRLFRLPSNPWGPRDQEESSSWAGQSLLPRQHPWRSLSTIEGWVTGWEGAHCCGQTATDQFRCCYFCCCCCGCGCDCDASGGGTGVCCCLVVFGRCCCLSDLCLFLHMAPWAIHPNSTCPLELASPWPRRAPPRIPWPSHARSES